MLAASTMLNTHPTCHQIFIGIFFSCRASSLSFHSSSSSSCLLRTCVSVFDACLQKIAFLFHTSDPIAKSMALSVLDALAPIVAERKDIHHLIGSSFFQPAASRQLADDAPAAAPNPTSYPPLQHRSALRTVATFSRLSPDFSSFIIPSLLILFEDINSPEWLQLQVCPSLFFFSFFSFIHLLFFLKIITILGQMNISPSHPFIFEIFSRFLNRLRTDLNSVEKKTALLKGLTRIALKASQPLLISQCATLLIEVLLFDPRL